MFVYFTIEDIVFHIFRISEELKVSQQLLKQLKEEMAASGDDECMKKLLQELVYYIIL